MTAVVLAAHQPSYLPWLGYLDKMARADVFVVMDDLQYEAQNFQNRNRIKVNNGAAWVTVPLERGTQSDRIIDKRINNRASPRQHWQRRTWLTLENNYRKAPHFADYADELRDVYTRPWDSLVDLDLWMLGLARRWLQITTPIVRSSDLGLVGQKSDRIIDMCRKVGANVYLSGGGGSKGYLDLPAFARARIDVVWQQFDHPVYPQRYPALGFLPNLAFLDLLFNCGPRSRELLLNPPCAAPLPQAKAS